MSKEIIAKCRDKQFNILCAVKGVCDKAGIRMMLLDNAALAAYRGDFVTDDITVCIDASDIQRFVDAFAQSKTGFVMDSMLTNGDFPAFELRIYDPDTIDYNNVEFMKYRYNSLYVRVVFVLHVPGSRFRKAYLSSMKNAYEIRNKVRFGERDESASKMSKLLGKREARKGKDEAAKWVFSKLAAGYSSGSEKILIDGTAFKAGVIGKGKIVKVNGTEFLIPGQPEKYFDKVFGKKWEEAEIPMFQESIKEFRDPDHSWEEYKSRISYMDIDGYCEDLKAYHAGYRRFKSYHNKVNMYRDILTRTDMRFKLWQKYMPLKDELVSLHEKGDYDKLSEMLKEYMHGMEQCEKKGLGLCFDEDILNITLDVYRHQGEAEHAAALDSLVPDEHREVLRLMDYKGEIIQ